MDAQLSDNVRLFDENVREYDDWFDRHPAVFDSELTAIQELLPRTGEGVEIGTGTGRFASALGLKVGVEPSPQMGVLARDRGLQVHQASAEKLPFADSTFDFALLVTVLCFVPDSLRALEETRRVLKPGGLVVIAFIDKDSRVGRDYLSSGSKYYRKAFFYSPRDMMDLLDRAGFRWKDARQTLFKDPREMDVPHSPKPGFGEGDFVVFSAQKPLADL